MREYVILPTTQNRLFILMPVTGAILRATHLLLQAMRQSTPLLDMWDVASITLRAIENDHTGNYARPVVYMRHPDAIPRLPPMTSLVAINLYSDFDASSTYREMVSSLWTFNGSGHPTNPNTFVLQEEDDKLPYENLAVSPIIYTSLLSDLINRNLHKLAI